MLSQRQARKLTDKVERNYAQAINVHTRELKQYETMLRLESTPATERTRIIQRVAEMHMESLKLAAYRVDGNYGWKWFMELGEGARDLNARLGAALAASVGVTYADMNDAVRRR